MALVFEHDIGGWEVGMALAGDGDELGVAFVAIASRLRRMSPDELENLHQSVAYHLRREGGQFDMDADVVNLMTLIKG